MTYNYSVYIGRFQPFHNGHMNVMMGGLKISNNIIIMCGSSNQTRTLKNPFIYDERKKFILDSLSKSFQDRIYIEPLEDYGNDIEWVKNVEKKVQKIIKTTSENKVALIGHTKDDSCYYLKLFKKWKYLEMQNFAQIDATYIRNIFFTDDKCKIEAILQKLMPKEVLKFMLDFMYTKDYQDLLNLYKVQHA